MRNYVNIVTEIIEGYSKVINALALLNNDLINIINEREEASEIEVDFGAINDIIKKFNTGNNKKNK
jgi:hypothetical protein